MFSSDSILGRDFQIIAAGLDGLAMRQQAHAENLGNVDTEGYRAHTVNFEGVLKNALNAGRAGGGYTMDANGARIPNSLADAVTAGQLSSNFASTERGGAASKVDRTDEVQGMMKDNIRFRVLTQQVTNRISELKNVISEMGRS